ncbi:cholinephosphate cytidylyltransferase, putative [Perkinsus marinus ATCC 50983]|uniref:ethanolamine-phosphate cytidylyltransferase n=1 Tax=Perkinsus marinus (strain ATCC 50983 / TXsc) TaxID=423536 RepID=C5LCI9_PERM5|nr:cholinephosphate cytidylyltransferase, putative [Perkinsus marinus ATCC 50983]EER05672.1 cholinephosphate cytidylyltransferase, putative [Perkinsus marinus ATCC 50983]|eukprot:XP_002773856.1 cholinephosphate cytidylyltransferase, putative [Perkinsus marinus ATCC 50983]
MSPPHVETQSHKTIPNIFDKSVSTRIISPIGDLYRKTHPYFASATAIVMFTLYQLFDCVDGKHAKNIRNESPLGYLFNQACDNVAVIFIIITMAMLMGFDPDIESDARCIWYSVQTGQLVFLWSQLSAFKKGFITYGLFTGPGEALFVFQMAIVVKVLTGFDYFWGPISRVLAMLPDALSGDPVSQVHTVYYAFLIALIIRVAVIKETPATRNILLFCLLYRTVPMVARMAHRDVHGWLVFMAMVSLLDKLAIIACAVFYYCSIFYDICSYMNLPMFTPVKNVYIDGVFDLCHLGHKNHIARALNYGNRLFVGVMSDEDVRKYKRDPIMTLEERVAEVQSLRCVYKVIPNAPCFGMDKEFIRKWNIHVVLASPEYDKPDDNYYKVPREMGILQIMPRTEGVSTSDIIKRIKNRTDLD